jgi:hypothetical protein
VTARTQCSQVMPLTRYVAEIIALPPVMSRWSL